MIILENIGKSYQKRIIFEQLSLKIEKNKMTAIKGRVGTGKSTLLKIIAGLDTNYRGSYTIAHDIQPKDDKKLSNYRLQEIGYIPQDYQLLNHLTCLDNIALPLRFMKEKEDVIKQKVDAIIDELGISHLKTKYPTEISGGQSQLVAIARALVKEPSIIIGDEPTGALDRETEEAVLECLKRRLSDNTYVIIATHSQKVASSCQCVITIPYCNE